MPVPHLLCRSQISCWRGKLRVALRVRWNRVCHMMQVLRAFLPRQEPLGMAPTCALVAAPLLHPSWMGWLGQRIVRGHVLHVMHVLLNANTHPCRCHR